jgi:hypothetical protein
VASAFQPGAFQGTSFQSLVASGEAFQRGAFQFGAFQTGGGTTVGRERRPKAKRKWIVLKDGELLVFTDKKAALTVLASTKEPQEIEPEVKAVPTPKPKEVKQAKRQVQEVIALPDIRELAKRQGEIDAVNRMIAAAQYAALMALVQRMQDEEDIEMLLMAL